MTQRRWPRRVLVVANIFVAVCVAATALGYGFIRLKYGQINKIDLKCTLRKCGDDDAGAPMNVLLVGSDTRATATGEDVQHFGSSSQVSGQRSDTIMILHVDPRAEKAAILSIPRDTYLPIAGTGRSDRVNTAFEKGPGVLVDTITRDLGIPIDHYASVDFVGFRGIVNAVGGVVVPFPAPARDKVTGLNVPNAGCINLTGDQALAYARSRHFQTFESGRWREDPLADLGRITRQQDFIRRVMRKAISRGIRNPFKMQSLISQGVKYVTIDKTLSSKDIFRIGKRFRSLDPNAVDMMTLPGLNANIGGASVLRIKQPDAKQVIDRFTGAIDSSTQNGPPPNIPPSTVTVRVLNGSGVGGQAGQTALKLQNFGFNTAATGDADSFNYSTPVIKYGKGQQLKARLLAAYIDGGAQIQSDTSIKGVDLVFVTGSALRTIRAPGTAAAPTTTAVTSPNATKPQPKAPPALNC